ncbi:hypothetical protein AYO49_04395 [Verrucomicrobiaceae bacterium SCGC AG-212-N21]|nr:hypothetical protein AYO49_04395 [Verrucomicrobiaceae bacterium SCGC AG-212-N21]
MAIEMPAIAASMRRSRSEAIGWWIVFGLFASGLLLLALGGPGPGTMRTLYVNMCVGIGVVWLQARRIRGKVLIDCGPHPQNRFTAVMIFCFAIFIPIKLLASSHGHFGMDDFASLFFGFLCAILMHCRRLQVTDRGIWRYEGLMRWEDITAYGWTKEGNLEVGRAGHLTIAVPIPAEKRLAVEELVSRYCPMRETAASS